MTWREARKQLQQLLDGPDYLQPEKVQAIRIAIERLLEVEDLEGSKDP